MPGTEGGVRFEVLGPLRVRVDGTDFQVGSARARAVLAMLLLYAGRTVLVDQLSEAVWANHPPRSARNQIQTCVSQLRRQLAAPSHPIVTEPAGYRLQADPDRVDAHRFRSLVADARAAVTGGRDGDARTHYRAAVGLWRGAALSDVDSDLVRELAGTLDAEREQALEECLEVELALGGAGELAPELTELVHRYPYRERLHAALMRALYRAGRPADALAAFRRVRQRFHDELGTEPGDQLQVLHQAILNNEPDPAGAGDPVAMRGSVTVHELPIEASCFVGREAEAVQVRDTLAPAERAGRRRPPVVVLYGPGGTGKSALAVRVARELAGDYPDGQLYVDLCGSTPGIRPVPAVEALGRFLRRLGVHPSEIPSGQAEAAAQFRSVTTGRRLLLVLDNAADKEQVADLVPGAPSCGVLVTSRYPLPTLDADDRRRVAALPDSDGLALLTGLTGRPATDPGAAAKIVVLCGGLPLAIRIAAGRLATRPDLSVVDYARRLADRSRRLDELQLDNLAVRASIRTSYDALLADDDPAGVSAARAFRMLGLLQVPDVAPLVVAAMLAESEVENARSALDRLVDAQLLEPVTGGRYRLHDLVRLVAAERASEDDTEADRDEALYRATAFYTAALWRAKTTMRSLRASLFGRPRVPARVPIPPFTEVPGASTWVDLELASLEAMHTKVVAMKRPVGRLALWLSDALWSFLDIRCEWRSAFRVSQEAIEGARNRRDTELEALGLLLHGRSLANIGSYGEARLCLERSLDAMRRLNNEPGVVLALNGLGVVHERRGDTAAALSSYEEALGVATAHNLVGLIAGIKCNVMVSCVLLGQLDRAVVLGEQTVGICVAQGDTYTHALARNNLATAFCLRGDHASALNCADQALRLSDTAGDRHSKCDGLLIRSEANRRAERFDAALMDAERARSLAEAAGYRYAAAAAERQRSRVLAALGMYADAESADAHARRAFSALEGHVFRDPMLESIVAT